MRRSFLPGLLMALPTAGLLAQTPAALPAATATLPAFWQEQLRYPRVRAAQAAAWPRVLRRLNARYLDPQRLEILLRFIKTELTLEVWARNRDGGPFELLHAYPLAAVSGTLGPKRRAGDEQMPEGFYTIDRFNPSSLYHMSLGLDYPNAADRALGEPNPGGDIFIHGSNVTIGCLPITNAGIEEVYLLAVAARAGGQRVIPVHLFPFPLTPAELGKHRSSPHAAFWQTLAPGYAYFEAHHEPLPAGRR